MKYKIEYIDSESKDVRSTCVHALNEQMAKTVLRRVMSGVGRVLSVKEVERDERQLAENICSCHARTIVDNAGGVTLGGNGLAEGFAAMWHNMDTYACEQALRHWVESAGYQQDGTFKYIISNHILNC